MKSPIINNQKIIKMETLTIDQAVNLLIKEVENESGKSFKELIKSISITNEYGTKYGIRKFKKCSLMYTGNPNYANASGTGGAGWYFKAYFNPGMCSSLKIKTSLL